MGESDEYEDKTKDCNKESDQFEVMIRDMGKKVQLSAAKMDEAEKDFKDKDEDVNAQNRRVLLLEEESRISVEKLATTVMKLAHMSKDADNIVKSCRHWESKTMKNAEARVVVIEDELAAIGENQKALEVSEEKARRREEKYQDQIKQIQIRLKQSDSRSEYAEMNISKLHLRIDELEDEIIREKLKINAVSGQLDDTFNEMLNKY